MRMLLVIMLFSVSGCTTVAYQYYPGSALSTYVEKEFNAISGQPPMNCTVVAVNATSCQNIEFRSDFSIQANSRVGDCTSAKDVVVAELRKHLHNVNLCRSFNVRPLMEGDDLIINAKVMFNKTCSDQFAEEFAHSRIYCSGTVEYQVMGRDVNIDRRDPIRADYEMPARRHMWPDDPESNVSGPINALAKKAAEKIVEAIITDANIASLTEK